MSVGEGRGERWEDPCGKRRKRKHKELPFKTEKVVTKRLAAGVFQA